MVMSTKKSATEAARDAFKDQIQQDACNAMKRSKINLKVWARSKALRQWKKNADGETRFVELSSLHEMVMDSNRQMVCSLMKQWFLSLQIRRKKHSLGSWIRNCLEDKGATASLEHHIELSNAREINRETNSEIASLKHEILILQGDLQDRTHGYHREKRNREWELEQMDKERTERVQREIEASNKYNEAIQELHYLKGMLSEHEETSNAFSKCRQDLLACQVENASLHEALKDHDGVVQGLSVLKSGAAAADRDRLRLKELEQLYAEKEYAASSYKKELTLALLEVERLKSDLNAQGYKSHSKNANAASANQ